MSKIKKKRKQQLRTKQTIIICLLSVLVVIGLSISFIVTNKAESYTFPFDSSDSPVSGIDVSHHNGDIDWELAAQEIDFAFIRVGYSGYGTGALMEDTRALSNLKNAKKAGVPIGVYYYSQATNKQEAKNEAEFVLEFIKKHDVQLPVVIDFEYPFDGEGKPLGRLADAKLSPEDATELVNEFCKRVQKEGYISGVYASAYTFEAELNANKLDKDAIIWVADYRGENKYSGEYDIWQYSKSGSCNGVSSENVDLNYWYL